MAFVLRRVAATTRSRLTQPAKISRYFGTTRVARNDASANLGSPPAQKPPIGGFRGGIIGFSLGFSLVAVWTAYSLVEENRLASAALQASVEELRITTEKISEHIRRIDAVEKDLKSLAEACTTKEETRRARSEMKKLYDDLHLEILNLKTHIWGIQQDVHAIAKKDATVVRI